MKGRSKHRNTKKKIILKDDLRNSSTNTQCSQLLLAKEREKGSLVPFPTSHSNFLKVIQTVNVLNINGERCHSNISERSNNTDEASYNMLMLDLKLLSPNSSSFDEAQVDMTKTSQNSWYYTL
jgi:hypothetical protein